MRECLKFYIGGQWVDPAGGQIAEVINPATEAVSGRVALGTAADVDKAVAAARTAFPAWSATPVQTRIALLEHVVEVFRSRVNEMAELITEEMGAPTWLSLGSQAAIGPQHFQITADFLKKFSFHQDRGTHRVVKEPIGVCGFITPWNWPIHQICAKTAPALAVGCTVVLKPSELAPYSAQLFAEILDAAGVPPGVFNLVQGEGPVVGSAIAAHPGVDMVSLTGSTRAGADVARAAAASIKRVHQELGGKSPNIVLEDADLTAAVTGGVNAVMSNSGQSCRAPTRMLVPNKLMPQVAEIAKQVAANWTVGDPKGDSRMGPVISGRQWDKVQGLIRQGIEAGAEVVTGGPGRPDGLSKGYFVRPTIFAGVTNDMAIAREEIFGPVLCILGYDTEEQALAIANDTDYGLGGYVQSKNLDRARAVASKIRAGYVCLNNAPLDLHVPFGGYKHSGNGREFSDYAFDEFLEVKSILGFNPQP
ncbi:MAG: aldehyde dehydrogenase family protein [Nevskiaceae bacterium]|jgi:aldehyde dehydrogenase (NAD+)|nr:aldehyde dehydrogenase family protein [Nevskiaceae bacterium]